MRNQTPLAPGEPASDVTVHIVLNDFGDRLGRAYCETDEAAADEASIIENIIDGEYSCPAAPLRNEMLSTELDTGCRWPSLKGPNWRRLTPMVAPTFLR